MTIGLFLLILPTALGFAVAALLGMWCFFLLCANIVSQVFEGFAMWEELLYLFAVGCVSGTIGCLFAGIIYLIK